MQCQLKKPFECPRLSNAERNRREYCFYNKVSLICLPGKLMISLLVCQKKKIIVMVTGPGWVYDRVGIRRD